MHVALTTHTAPTGQHAWFRRVRDAVTPLLVDTDDDALASGEEAELLVLAVDPAALDVPGEGREVIPLICDDLEHGEERDEVEATWGVLLGQSRGLARLAEIMDLQPHRAWEVEARSPYHLHVWAAPDDAARLMRLVRRIAGRSGLAVFDVTSGRVVVPAVGDEADLLR